MFYKLSLALFIMLSDVLGKTYKTSDIWNKIHPILYLLRFSEYPDSPLTLDLTKWN